MIKKCSDDLEERLFSIDAVNTVGIGWDASGHDALCIGLEEGSGESEKQEIRNLVEINVNDHHGMKVPPFALVFKTAQKLVLDKGADVKPGSKYSFQEEDSQKWISGSIGLVLEKGNIGWAITSGHAVGARHGEFDFDEGISVRIESGSDVIMGSVVATLLRPEAGVDVALVKLLSEACLDHRCVQISGDEFLTSIEMRLLPRETAINKVDDAGKIRAGEIDEYDARARVAKRSELYRSVILVKVGGKDDGRQYAPFSEPGDSGACCYIAGENRSNRAFVGVVIGSSGERGAISRISSFRSWLEKRIDVRSLTVFYRHWATTIRDAPALLQSSKQETLPSLSIESLPSTSTETIQSLTVPTVY